MCARLLACPLCSQPGFLTLDALRAGLVSVATRQLACPVCNEVLLGIDKLTIHLFGHTINQNQLVLGAGNDTAKIIQVTTGESGNVQATIVRNGQSIPIQSWNLLNANQSLEAGSKPQEAARESTGSGIYIPIDEIESFRNLTAIKDANNVIPVNNGQSITTEMKGPSQVIFLQNVTQQPKIISANLISQSTNPETLPPGLYQAIPAATTATCTTNNETTPMDQTCRQENNINGIDAADTSKNDADSTENESNRQTSSQYSPSHTDRLADLVKNAQITASPLGTFHDSYDCSKPASPEVQEISSQRNSSRILPAVERTERCNICGFHFPDRNILILHKQLVHMIKEKDSNIAPEDLMKNYPCHLCTKVFKMRGSLMVHMRVAHPGFNAVNSARSTLQKEQRREQSNETETTSNESENSYSCPICSKKFKKEQHVTQHIKIHDGKQWECDVCSKMFTTKYFLKKHKRLHSGEMPYKCNICDKTFTFQQSYHKHKLYHKDDKPHSCASCGRSFKELSTLHNHERIHTGEKPFACETCGKRFRQRVSYLVHRRIHTGAMPYNCTACGKNFRYKVSQRTHKCSQQPSESPTEQMENVDNPETSEMDENQETLREQIEQTMDSPNISEENQYVLVLNEKGHHVLKKKKDVPNSNDPNREGSIEHDKDSTNESDEFMSNIWNENTTSEMDFKETSNKTNELVSNIMEDTSLWNGASNNKDDSQTPNDNISKRFHTKVLNNEFTNNIWNQASANEASYEKTSGKNQSNNADDFFSLVMSPLENEISSPSTEMKHLRLSSPVGSKENSSEANDSFPPMDNSTNAVQVDSNGIGESFRDNNVNLSTLQTINEDSLKELLYSITDR